MNRRVTAWRASFGSARRELSNPSADYPRDVVWIEIVVEKRITTNEIRRGVCRGSRRLTRDGDMGEKTTMSICFFSPERTVFSCNGHDEWLAKSIMCVTDLHKRCCRESTTWFLVELKRGVPEVKYDSTWEGGHGFLQSFGLTIRTQANNDVHSEAAKFEQSMVSFSLLHLLFEYF